MTFIAANAVILHYTIEAVLTGVKMDILMKAKMTL